MSSVIDNLLSTYEKSIELIYPTNKSSPDFLSSLLQAPNNGEIVVSKAYMIMVILFFIFINSEVF